VAQRHDMAAHWNYQRQIRLGSKDSTSYSFVDPNICIEDWDFGSDGLHLNWRGVWRLWHFCSRVCNFSSEGPARWNMWQRLAVGTGIEETAEGMRQTSIQENLTLGWRTAEREMATKNLARSETEDRTWDKLTIMAAACRLESKSLVLLHLYCRNIYVNTLDIWILLTHRVCML
jgi:hypothetical protein